MRRKCKNNARIPFSGFGAAVVSVLRFLYDQKDPVNETELSKDILH